MEQRPPARAVQAQVFVRCNPSFCFGLQITAPGVSWVALLSLPHGFQVRACCVVQFIYYQRVCPLHLQHLWKSSPSAGCCLHSFQSSLWLMVLGHQIRKILLMQVLMNVWIFLGVAAMVLHVSAPYSRTGFTVVLKIPILMLMVRLGEVQMFFIWRKAALAADSHFTLVSLPPCLSAIGKWNLSHLVIHLHPVLQGQAAMLFLRTLLLLLWIFRPKPADLSITVLVFFCICSWV